MPSKFKFRKNDTIGAADAAEDGFFLSECFVDTGDIDVLLDCGNPKRIILGRTGTGKTALIDTLAKMKAAIVIYPENLSLNHLANSTVISFFADLGVKLDLFFKLLWRHVLTVELIKKRYNIRNEDDRRNFLQRIADTIMRDKTKERAISYLREWGDHFWEETEYRVKEITSKVESQLKESIGFDIKCLTADLSSGINLSEEQKADVVRRGQNVINSLQMRELTDILDFLNEDVFHDDQNHFYVCIDKLDENWVEDKFKYLLIRSLIETLRDFRKVRNVKIITAIRYDLLGRIFKYTRDSGFQEEKYRDMYLNVKWTELQLQELLEKRINYLIKHVYTTKPVTCEEILPASIDGVSGIVYILQRTFCRPREVIEFFNCCIENADGKSVITKPILGIAEAEYSKRRLWSLQDEWSTDYPMLSELTHILKKRPISFKICDISDNDVLEFCYNYLMRTGENPDFITQLASRAFDDRSSIEILLRNIFHVLFKTGVIGIKTDSYLPYCWSFNSTSNIGVVDINIETKVSVHPTFWRALGIITK